MNKYPHMCRDGHQEVGYSGDGERCPVCEQMDMAGATCESCTAVAAKLADHYRAVLERIAMDGNRNAFDCQLNRAALIRLAKDAIAKGKEIMSEGQP